MSCPTGKSLVRSCKRWSPAAGAGLLLLLAVSCTQPPGKPTVDEAVDTEPTDFTVLYGSNCAACHGENGNYGAGRPLNNALYMALISREELHQVLEYGRPGTQMPAWARPQGGPFTEKQIAALIDGMEKRWNTGFNAGSAPLPSYSAGDLKGEPAHGKELFTRSCAICHGAHGQVGPVTDPSYLSLVSNQMLRTSIIVGRSDLGMPNYKVLNRGKPLSSQDVTDLVTYVASFRPANAVPEGAHTDESGAGSGAMTKGNEGSGNGPGSPQQKRGEGHKFNGGGSQGGGPSERR